MTSLGAIQNHALARELALLGHEVERLRAAAAPARGNG